VQETNWSLGTRLVSLASTARIAVFIHFLSDSRPPIPTADIISRLLGTKVPKDRMSLFNYCSREAMILRDYTRDTKDFVLSAISSVEKSFSILKRRES